MLLGSATLFYHTNNVFTHKSSFIWQLLRFHGNSSATWQLEIALKNLKFMIFAANARYIFDFLSTACVCNTHTHTRTY